MAASRSGMATAAYLLSLMLAAIAWRSGPGEPPARPLAGCPLGHTETASFEGRTTRVACLEPGDRPAPVRGAARWLVGLPIELNRASAETLTLLPGIGPGRAAAITAARCQSPFVSLEEVQRVRGIGPRTAASLVGRAVAGPAPTDCPQGSTTLPP